MAFLDRSRPDPGIPRRLLRQLFENRRIGAGARVLDVGSSRGELLRFLDQLCLDVSRLDKTAGDVASSLPDFPNVTCRCGTLSEPLPFPSQYFNLILARDPPEYAADLFGPRALCATARLLAAIRPGGILCLIRRVLPLARTSNEQAIDHDDHCFRMHLEAFASDVQLAHAGAGWNWCSRGTPRARYLTVTALVPPESISLNEWLRTALKTANRQTAACCPAAARNRHAAAIQRGA
jgi:SAM-dependent methyltransferase